MLFLSLSGRFCCRFRATGGQEARRSAVAGSEAELTQVNILLTHPDFVLETGCVGGRVARFKRCRRPADSAGEKEDLRQWQPCGFWSSRATRARRGSAMRTPTA